MSKKAVLISIQPIWCEKIASGEKVVEVRKTRPKLETPFKCYIYETKGFLRVGNENLNSVVGGSGRGKVVGEFVCDAVYSIDAEHVPALKDAFHGISCNEFLRKSCLSAYDLLNYLTASEQQISIEYRPGYGWHISDLVIYDQPKQLSEFKRHDPSYDFASFGEVDRACTVTRPPQSWCYVEEMEE